MLTILITEAKIILNHIKAESKRLSRAQLTAFISQSVQRKNSESIVLYLDFIFQICAPIALAEVNCMPFFYSID